MKSNVTAFLRENNFSLIQSFAEKMFKLITSKNDKLLIINKQVLK